MSETNRYLNGKKHGHWVERDEDGNVAEGPYVEGRRHGHWIERYPEGSPWRDRMWTTRSMAFGYSDPGTGRAAEGPYVERQAAMAIGSSETRTGMSRRGRTCRARGTANG